MTSAGGLGRTLRVVEGDFQCLLELLDVRLAVCVAEYSGEVLDGLG